MYLLYAFPDGCQLKSAVWTMWVTPHCWPDMKHILIVGIVMVIWQRGRPMTGGQGDGRTLGWVGPRLRLGVHCGAERDRRTHTHIEPERRGPQTTRAPSRQPSLGVGHALLIKEDALL